jgi:hypothetical protein
VRIERRFPSTAEGRTKLLPARGLPLKLLQTTRRKKPTRGQKRPVEAQRPSRA